MRAQKTAILRECVGLCVCVCVFAFKHCAVVPPCDSSQSCSVHRCSCDTSFVAAAALPLQPSLFLCRCWWLCCLFFPDNASWLRQRSGLRSKVLVGRQSPKKS